MRANFADAYRDQLLELGSLVLRRIERFNAKWGRSRTDRQRSKRLSVGGSLTDLCYNF
jgi:hypothetical protein